MRISHQPYHHTDSKWYIRKGKRFYRSYGAFDTERECREACLNTEMRDAYYKARDVFDMLVKEFPDNYTDDDLDGGKETFGDCVA